MLTEQAHGAGILRRGSRAGAYTKGVQTFARLREKVTGGRMRGASAAKRAFDVARDVRGKGKSSSLRSRPHPALRATFSRCAGEGLDLGFQGGGVSTARTASSGTSATTRARPSPSQSTKRKPLEIGRAQSEPQSLMRIS